MPTFPTYAGIIDSGFTETPDYGVKRTDMEGGIAKQRASWTKAIVRRTATVLVHSLEDRLLFDAWVRDDLAGGARWFDWRDIDGVVKKARFVNGALTWAPQGGPWTAQTQLETVGT